jgi:hypothetical protein
MEAHARTGDVRLRKYGFLTKIWPCFHFHQIQKYLLN